MRTTTEKTRDELLRKTQKLRAELTALEALIWELFNENPPDEGTERGGQGT